MQGTIWQSLLDYARIAWDTMRKEFKQATTYDIVLVTFNMVWGGNDVIYHRSNDKILWHIRAPYVSLVTHVYQVLHTSWGYVVPP